MEHHIHYLDKMLDEQLAMVSSEMNGGDGDSMSFGGIHRLLMQSGVYSADFNKADASSLFFAVLRAHGGASGESRGAQRVSNGRLPLMVRIDAV